jgi:PhoPQ-activated pathogenicity-related protein
VSTPVHGDLIVFAAGSCGASSNAGHVAVIDVVDSVNQQLTIVDENGPHRWDVSMSCASCYLHATANNTSGN